MWNLAWPWLLIVAGLIALLALGRVRGPSLAARGSVVSREAVQGAVTLAVLASALYVILSGGYQESEQKWAFGAVGTVVGFWLRK